MENIEISEVDEFILPGFRFHPTDQELVGFYLKKKIQQKPLSVELIKQLDIYKFDPWDLPKLAASGEKEWYFYCPRDRKYRNSARPNRVTGAGFWKATGTDRPIYSSDGTCSASSKCIGLKKSLVFYKGRAAKGIKTDWMMHEFRLPSIVDHSVGTPKRYIDKTIPANDSWAICRIFKKTNSTIHRVISQSWVSPLSETLTPKSLTHDSISTYFNNNNIISMTPNVTNTSSPLQNFSINPNVHFQQPTTFSPLHNHALNPNDHVSSMPLNMQSSTFEDFSVSSQGHSHNGLLSTTSPQETYQVNLMINTKEGDEIIKAPFMLSDQILTRDINEDDWAGEVRSFGLSTLGGVPLNMSLDNVWKSNLFWDYSSACPSEMATSYSSY